jgi:hypothetical protein
VNNPLARKAIIVAGAEESDPLWPAVDKCSRLAYDTLRFQGYSDDDIHFMGPSAVADEPATVSNLDAAINTWAWTNTQDLVLYLVGDGGQGTFQINGAETLAATQLDSWLDDLQDQIPGKVVVLYDGPGSGSFVSLLVPPEGKERIVLASTGPNEPAYFLSNGDISFSAFFWRQVLNGGSVRDGFVHAINAIGYACPGQIPVLDDSGNGIGNESGTDGRLARYTTIGVGIMLAGDDPVIGSVSPDQFLSSQPSATIWAGDVTATGTIAEVWGVITPPGSSLTSEAMTDLPIVELEPVGNGRYEGTYTGFSVNGTYGVAVYAMDAGGSVSLPEPTTVTVSGNGTGMENGYLVTNDLWIRATIHTEEAGDIEGVWQKGGEDTTAAGDRVIWGHFYASPVEVTWGSPNNPDLYVKIWFDHSGRVDANFFHVSVPDIEVYSDYTYDGSPDEQGTTTMTTRYIRQYYQDDQSFSEGQDEDGYPGSDDSPGGDPSGYLTINDLKIGGMINTVELGPIEAIWQLGGQDTTTRGDQVVWGHFYASPEDVTWGSPNNPDLFVKIWFDASGRVDVNFFHVSVPDIEVYSDLPDDGTYDQQGTTIMSNRYVRQEYQR